VLSVELMEHNAMFTCDCVKYNYFKIISADVSVPTERNNFA